MITFQVNLHRRTDDPLSGLTHHRHTIQSHILPRQGDKLMFKVEGRERVVSGTVSLVSHEFINEPSILVSLCLDFDSDMEMRDEKFVGEI